MRLFLALDLDDAVRRRMAALLEELRAPAPGIKWVAHESLHITLKFIGEQREEKLQALKDALGAVARPGPLDITFRGLGCYPGDRRPRVFWAGVEAPPQLAQLAAAIDAALEPFGIEREARKFSPHLTIGRAREPARPPAALSAALEAHRQDEFGRVAAREFVLYQSVLSPRGSVYTRLHSFSL